jgi:hypothetical protein
VKGDLIIVVTVFVMVATVAAFVLLVTGAFL